MHPITQPNEEQALEVNPQEFGIELSKAIAIESVFTPKVIESEGYFQVYQNILTKEITKDVCEEASELRKKLMKVRTGILAIHKTEKAFYLAGGKFVDALKNKHIAPIEQMEEKLREVEDYYENQQKAAKEQLRIERWSMLSTYMEYEPQGLSEMESEVFENFFEGTKIAHQRRIDAAAKLENEKKEVERLQAIVNQRNNILAPYSFFAQRLELNIPDVAVLSNEEFTSIVEQLQQVKDEFEAKQEAERLEIEQLRKEKLEAEKEAKRIELEQQKQLEKERADAKAKLDAEKEVARVLELELERRKQAEIKAEQEREALAELELAKGDADKFNDLLNDLELLKTKYQFKGKKNKATYAQCRILLDNIIDHLKN